MKKIETLREIADYLGLDSILAEIDSISSRACQDNANLILPLIGEFSSGKTSLLNSLMDSKMLETATKPTTATIFEVHFGCDACYAQIVNEEDEIVNADSADELKNDAVKEAQVVTVFDTSTRVPSSTILVDTPGLSSIDPKHKQTLVDFLPKADGVLVVVDINQQMTRSLSEFIETSRLMQLPLYLVITKSDTKSKSDIEAVKKYASENYQIPLRQMAVVSAMNDDLDELYALLDSIQADKKEIIGQVDSHRLDDIVLNLKEHVKDLMMATGSDEELDDAILKSQAELERINRSIERFVETMAEDVKEQEVAAAKKFETVISTRLNALVSGKSADFNEEAVAMINETAAALTGEYKNNVINILREKSARGKSADGVGIGADDEMDLSYMQASALNYYLDLNTMGHEYDGYIKTGVIAVAAIGAVAAAAASGGGAAAAVASGASVGTALDVADTVTDVGAIIATRRSMRRIERAAHLMQYAKYKYDAIDDKSKQLGEKVGAKKGLIESMVGFVTDNLRSKPQRIHAINNYINTSLAPEFKDNIQSLSLQLIDDVRYNLQQQAVPAIKQKTESLNQLKEERMENKAMFEERMEQLRQYQAILMTM